MIGVGGVIPQVNIPVWRALAQTGIKAISLSTTTPELNNTLTALRDFAAEKGLSLVWDLPVPYSAFNPVALEIAGDAPSDGAGRAWLYVEPDGDVLPDQGILQPMGNLLTDSWESIWRQHKRMPVG